MEPCLSDPRAHAPYYQGPWTLDPPDSLCWVLIQYGLIEQSLGIRQCRARWGFSEL